MAILWVQPVATLDAGMITGKVWAEKSVRSGFGLAKSENKYVGIYSRNICEFLKRKSGWFTAHFVLDLRPPTVSWRILVYMSTF